MHDLFDPKALARFLAASDALAARLRLMKRTRKDMADCREDFREFHRDDLFNANDHSALNEFELAKAALTGQTPLLDVSDLGDE